MWHQRAAPIIRGSNGQGKSYQTLIRPDFGGHNLKDLEAAGTYSHGPAGVDPRHIGVVDGSPGGLPRFPASDTCLTFQAAGDNVLNLSNSVTFARAVPHRWRRLIEAWFGTPDEDVYFLWKRRSVTYGD